ncbi:hypothetical protein M3Y94_01128900 [Aphelenchoides besseyi]|nr:hypothetical protein M3Y94_01128900 [Aphelenchoides besseyi]
MAHDEQPDLVFDVELEGNLDWGIKVSENLHVIAIRDGGPFTGKCEIGDRIIQVNEIPMKTLEEFEHIAAQTNSMHIEVTRGLKTNEVQLLPPEREKNVQRRPGYAYRLVQIDYQKGCKFGLGIKHHQNKVFVSRVDDGSLSARALMLGDRLIDVNGNPVSDKDVARDLLLRSLQVLEHFSSNFIVLLQKFRTVTLIIERAESDEAKNATRQAMAASELQPPSVAMNSDIRDIVQRQNAKMQKGTCCKKSRGQASKGRVQIRSEQKNLIIATDHEGKPLKHVGPSK